MIEPVFDQLQKEKFYKWISPRADIEVDDYTTIGFVNEDEIVGILERSKKPKKTVKTPKSNMDTETKTRRHRDATAERRSTMQNAVRREDELLRRRAQAESTQLQGLSSPIVCRRQEPEIY